MNYKTRQPFPNAAYVEGQRNFTYFDRSLTSGLTDVIIESPGDFLYIDQASTGVVSVELNMRQGGTLAPILLAAGGSIECDFASIKLTASAQLNKSVRVIIGNGARIKGGANVNASSLSVSVVDGGKTRTLNNSAFSGYVYQAGVGGAYAHCQFFNPASSGKNIYIEKLLLFLTSAGTVSIGGYHTALATSNGVAQSKYLGGDASIAQLRYEANAAALITQTLGVVAIPANQSFMVEFTEPVLLAPGRGLVAINQTSAQPVGATAELFEE